jgi:adenine-specific DNA-methyltransferase
VTLRKGVFEDVLQEVILATYKRRSRQKTADIHIAEPSFESTMTITPAGQYKLPADGSQRWLLPGSTAHVSLLARLNGFKQRLADWGYGVSTGPLVWNRYKPQLVTQPKADTLPLIWAEAITIDGRFVWRAEKRNHAPYFKVKPGDDWLITREACVLLQRTTAKEQARRLIAAALPHDFLAKHKAVVIENHLNMIRPTVPKPKVAPQVLAAVLNSAAADRAFRCVSGSVAVSAYELQALPLPNANDTKLLKNLVAQGAPRAAIEAECARLFEGQTKS